MYSDVHELNFSKIKTYLECPLLYKYKYMDGRKEACGRFVFGRVHTPRVGGVSPQQQ